MNFLEHPKDQEENICFEQRDDDDLSDLSDFFEEDAHLLSLRVEVQELTLDEVPYDRDLKYINVAAGSRPTPKIDGKQLKAIRALSTLNVEEFPALDAKYKAWDVRKREHDAELGGNRRRNGPRKNQSKPERRNREPRDVPPGRSKGRSGNEREGNRGNFKHTREINAGEERKLSHVPGIAAASSLQPDFYDSADSFDVFQVARNAERLGSDLIPNSKLRASAPAFTPSFFHPSISMT